MSVHKFQTTIIDLPVFLSQSAIKLRKAATDFTSETRRLNTTEAVRVLNRNILTFCNKIPGEKLNVFL